MIRNFKKAIYAAMIQSFINNYIKNLFMDYFDVNLNFGKLLALIDSYNTFYIYFSDELKDLIRKKIEIHYKYRHYDNSDYCYEIFKQLRSSCHKMIKRDEKMRF